MDITNTQNQLLNVTGELAVEQEKTHALLEALKAVEWVGMSKSDEWANPLECPSCDMDKSQGHATDCQLAAALRLARGEQ